MKYEIASLQTKKAIAASLKKLMKTKPFSKITISEIIADVGVNRKTFYYHFEDIYALLKWIFESEAVEVIKQFDLALDYEEAISFVMDYVEKNDYIIECAYDSIGRDELKRFLFNDFIDLAKTIIALAEQEQNVTLDDDYKNFLCIFYTEAIAGILLDWIQNRHKQDKKQVIAFVSHTIKTSVSSVILTQKNTTYF